MGSELVSGFEAGDPVLIRCDGCWLTGDLEEIGEGEIVLSGARVGSTIKPVRRGGGLTPIGRIAVKLAEVAAVGEVPDDL